MSERLLNTLTKVATLGKYEIRLNPEFADCQQQLGSEERNAVTKLLDRGTLVIIDDANNRIIIKYQITRRKDDKWSSKSSINAGDGTFLEATGKTLDQHLFPE